MSGEQNPVGGPLSDWKFGEAVKDASERLQGADARLVESVDAVQQAADSAGRDSAASAGRATAGVEQATASAAAGVSSALSSAGATGARSVAAAGGSLVATFADIELMSQLISRHVSTTMIESGRVFPMSTNGDLLESVVLSPVTAAIAGGAVVTAAGRLAAHAALSQGLGIVAVTIVSTYQLADAALQVQAASVNFIVTTAGAMAEGSARVTVAVLAGAADVVVTGIGNSLAGAQAGAGLIGAHVAGVVDGAMATITVVIGGVEMSLALSQIQSTVSVLLIGALGAIAVGLLQEGFEAWALSYGDTFHDFIANPWLMALGPLALPLLTAINTGQRFELEDVAEHSIDNLQGYLGMLGPGYDVLVGGLLWSAGVFGWEDDGELRFDANGDPESLFTDTERADRLEAVLNELQLLGVDGLSWQEDAVGNIQPDSLSSLILSMSQIDQLGRQDEAVIRVITTPGDPPTFTVLVPSTQEWWPWGPVPNDILGNFGIVTGSSRLLMLTDQALAHAQAAYLADNPEYAGSLSSAPVMVGGFSQGGITAGEFAEQFSDKYNITQVVTVGSGLGRADVAPVNGLGNPVSVIAYEAKFDPVPGADGASNPEWFTTVKGDNGGGAGSHNALLYADMASQQSSPGVTNNTDVFFANPQDAIVTNYYATKD